MALPLYLAMTAAEIKGTTAPPPRLGYMACHFSPYGTGLSNCPKALPEGSILILNDRTPIRGHDPDRITAQLTDILEVNACRGLLLDFQRPGCGEAAELVAQLVKALPCPAAVSEVYAENLDCPVFLSPVPADAPLAEYCMPWKGREIWLEAALDGLEIRLTEAGASAIALPYPETPEHSHRDEVLHCHYQIRVSPEEARFTLYRTYADLLALLEEAGGLGISLAMGLWQELNRQESICRDARLQNTP